MKTRAKSITCAVSWCVAVVTKVGERCPVHRVTRDYIPDELSAVKHKECPKCYGCCFDRFNRPCAACDGTGEVIDVKATMGVERT